MFITLPLLVEDYNKDTLISFAPDLDKYNLEEILDNNKF